LLLDCIPVDRHRFGHFYLAQTHSFAVMGQYGDDDADLRHRIGKEDGDEIRQGQPARLGIMPKYNPYVRMMVAAARNEKRSGRAVRRWSA
jgi:hypothetical protein